MASEKDVLGKADALLRRHAGGTGSDTGGVPVLTDIVDDEDAATAELVREISARVMTAVEKRLAADLEERLARQFSAQVQGAVASALDELRQELSQTIGEAVTEALQRTKP